ncbi:hypothetical protein SAMN00777080_4030 [Aquiflexum balticum DSM 16537]|jgi:hypothetical protein|uniref:Uncharacterized protein n=1 Tax=Aquiflexum balticum DSM 16537 TaxID=758820 RepID=A0A1W2H928_9BACT|nr:hypothetical protein [Aquiflexum balticum]SMD45381.1 hypothetical protein SAMN00777080_4030 [Aquiflexum balticum DSM 16537]
MDSKVKFKDLLKTAVTELQGLTSVSNPDFRLEQAEYLKSKNEWDIVVSFLVQNTNPKKGVLVPSYNFEFERVYKRLKINSHKEVLGLYIFEN